jgi:hypothetical protein
MARLVKDIKKPRGRPRTTGTGTPLLVRMHGEQIRAIDKWRDDREVTRAEAIRRLVELGLRAKK